MLFARLRSKETNQNFKTIVGIILHKYIYTKLYDKIKKFDCTQGFAHLLCRTNLRTKVDIYAKRYAEAEDDSESGMDISLNESTSS